MIFRWFWEFIGGSRVITLPSCYGTGMVLNDVHYAEACCDTCLWLDLCEKKSGKDEAY